MTERTGRATGPLSTLRRTELVMFGKNLVAERLEEAGSVVEMPRGRTDGRLQVRTPSGRSLEVFVSTQRVGGYVFWTKRRLHPAEGRYAAIVLLDGDEEPPAVYLVPSPDWLHAKPPLKDRDNVGKRSEPEFGISLARSSLPALERYAWNNSSTEHLR
jgi:hypothetical protein